MNPSESDLGPAFGAAAAASRARAPEHADLDVLAAYRRGELPESDAEALREHLAGCRECGDLLLDLEAFEADAEAAAEGGAAADLEEAASWRAVRLRIDRPAGGDAGAGWHLPRAAAAALAAALIGAVGWGAYQRAELAAERSAPQPDLPVINLIREHTTRGVPPAPHAWQVPRGGRFLFSIIPDTPLAGARYRVVIESRDGVQVWSGELVGDDDGYLNLGFSRRLLPDRDYTVRLLPLDDGGEAETLPLRFSR